MLSLCPFDISVAIREKGRDLTFVIGLSQISSFFLMLNVINNLYKNLIHFFQVY